MVKFGTQRSAGGIHICKAVMLIDRKSLLIFSERFAINEIAMWHLFDAQLVTAVRSVYRVLQAVQELRI